MKRHIMLAMILTSCADNRTQAQKDHRAVQAAIMQRLGPDSPYSNPVIVNAHRSPTHPEVVCGYWDATDSRDRTSYQTFAYMTDIQGLAIEGVGKTYYHHANDTGDRQTIRELCDIKP